VIAVLVAAVAVVVTRAVPARYLGRRPHRSGEMSVTLSVLPTRTAVVVLGVETVASSTALARLVEHAVRDAFVFDAVDAVEVRRRNGELLERRRRNGAVSA
jgi:Ethanolamine utilization protein EutJ (predicted chaperonin)